MLTSYIDYKQSVQQQNNEVNHCHRPLQHNETAALLEITDTPRLTQYLRSGRSGASQI
jgi:hypothetical protein